MFFWYAWKPRSNFLNTTTIRADLLYGNSREYERDSVADVMEQHPNINNTMSIAYLRALGDGYSNSRTRCRRCLNEKGEGGDNERSG